MKDATEKFDRGNRRGERFQDRQRPEILISSRHHTRKLVFCRILQRNQPLGSPIEMI